MMKQIVKSMFMVMTLILAGCVTDKIEPEDALSAGDRCPEFSVQLLDGSSFSSTDTGGRTALIAFFNTDCSDCRRELPILQKAYDELTASAGGQAPQFICISRAQPEASVRAYWEEHGLTLPVAPQSDNAVYRLFANVGIPRIFIVDPSGIIVAAWSDDPLPGVADIISHF